MHCLWHLGRHVSISPAEMKIPSGFDVFEQSFDKGGNKSIQHETQDPNEKLV